MISHTQDVLSLNSGLVQAVNLAEIKEKKRDVRNLELSQEDIRQMTSRGCSKLVAKWAKSE
jgi:hypothetical protein